MLRIFLDNEFLEFDDEDLDIMYIDEGCEGVVYKYGVDAIKIYKNTCFFSRLGLEECQQLKLIKTKRILLPEKIVYGDDNEFMGYSTPFIYNVSNIKMLNMNINNFIDELDIISSDLKLLADNGVEIEDWHINNVLYNGKFFIGDPGGMFFRERMISNRIYRNNVFTLNRFLKEDVFSLARLSKSKKGNIERIFDDHYDMGLQIRDTCISSESLKQYIKRISK